MSDSRLLGGKSKLYLFLAAVIMSTLLVSGAGQRPAKAAGEAWYGQLEIKSTGKTFPTSDGGTYTSRDVATYIAPEDSEAATATISVDTDVTHPQPAGQPYCYTSLDHYWGLGTVPARIVVGSVYAGQGGRSMYSLNAYAPNEPGVTIYHETTWAGTKTDGSSCARTERDSGQSVYWFGEVRSFQNPAAAYRAGASTILTGSCGNYTTACISSQYEATSSDQEYSARWVMKARECSGYSQSWNIGKDDRLFLFNACQTKSLAARTSFLKNIPDTVKVCEYSFVKRLGKPCAAYKAITAIEWGQADWFMNYATINDGCGLWVVDGASWRSPKIKVATRSDGATIAWLNRGETVRVETARGIERVTCPG